MGSQRLKVSTQLSLCSLSVGKGSLRGKGCGYVVRARVWMAGLCILLDLVEGSLLGCRVLLQPRGMFEQIGRASLFPILLVLSGRGCPLAWMD
jgi:hypothetical protein